MWHADVASCPACDELITFLSFSFFFPFSPAGRGEEEGEVRPAIGGRRGERGKSALETATIRGGSGAFLVRKLDAL